MFPTLDRMEQRTVRRLRTTVAVVCVLGAASSLLGFLPEGLVVTDREYMDHFERAGGACLALYIALLLLPSIAVLWRPRWFQIIGWIVWALPLTAGALYLATGPGDNLYRGNEMLAPRWPGWIAYSLVAAILFAVTVVLPWLRALHRSAPIEHEPKLPVARTYRH